MKKIIITSLCLLLFPLINFAQSFYSISVRDIDGNAVTLQNYSGRKIMFVVLPMSINDSCYQQLSAFKARYTDTVKIVGIVSFEDGYAADKKVALKNMYSSLGIVLTEEMHTRKISGMDQPELIQWLTDPMKNQHFNVQVKGVGQTFFINEAGVLFAVLSPLTKLDSRAVDVIVHNNKALSGR